MIGRAAQLARRAEAAGAALSATERAFMDEMRAKGSYHVQFSEDHWFMRHDGLEDPDELIEEDDDGPPPFTDEMRAYRRALLDLMHERNSRHAYWNPVDRTASRPDASLSWLLRTRGE